MFLYSKWLTQQKILTAFAKMAEPTKYLPSCFLCL